MPAVDFSSKIELEWMHDDSNSIGMIGFRNDFMVVPFF